MPIGYKHSDATKLKMSLAKIGYIPWNKGKTGLFKHTEEHKQKLRDCWGEKNKNWRGGIIHSCDGYIRMKTHGHPFATKQGYVQEHRLVMEKYLGRYLYFWETVHHINGIKDDNRIENLMLLPKGEHNLQVQKVYQENLQLKQEIIELKLQLAS